MDSLQNFAEFQEKNQIQSYQSTQFSNLSSLSLPKTQFKNPKDFLCNIAQSDEQINSLKIIEQNKSFSESQDSFERGIEIKCVKLTSFENGFTIFHQKVLYNSFKQYYTQFKKLTTEKTQRKQKPNNNILRYKKLKKIIFNKQIFSSSQITQHKERFENKSDEYNITKSLFQSTKDQEPTITKEIIVMICWLLKNTDHITTSIKTKQSVTIKQAQQIKSKFIQFLRHSKKIQLLRPVGPLNRQLNEKYQVMIDSWIYTIVVAKLGYFDNQCYDPKCDLNENLCQLVDQQHNNLFKMDIQQSDEEQVQLLLSSVKRRKLDDI